MFQSTSVRRTSVVLAIAAGVSQAVFAQYPGTLMYAPRGNRSEGLAAQPRSADAIALVSALADVTPRETVSTWPENLRLRFYYPPQELAPVIRIRQLRSPTGYYVMDGVKPSTPWVAAATNGFAWPSRLAAQVYDYQFGAAPDTTTRSDWLTGLGVVVTLGSTGAAGSLQKLTVAPAVLDHTTRPLAVSSYLFSFRTNAPVLVTGAIVDASNHEVLSGLKYSAVSGSPFTVRWPVRGASEGWYQLLLDVGFAGQPQVIVRFFHKRSLAG